MGQNKENMESLDDIDSLLSTIDQMFRELGDEPDHGQTGHKELTKEQLAAEGYMEPQIEEILEGYRQGVDAGAYMDKSLNWKQMREVRLGLMQDLDVSYYNNRLYSAGQMQEIRLGLENGIDVSSYAKFIYATTDMRNKRLELSQNAYANNPEAFERKVVDDDTGFTVVIGKDSMDAYVIVTDASKESLSRRQIIKMLSLYGVTYGYVETGIDRAVRCELKNVKILVASGDRPTKGRDGYYEFYFDKDTEYTPVELEDGRVDYTSKIVENVVQRGQVLARYHRAGKGRPGRTVTDFPVQGISGKKLRNLKGHGIRYDDDTGEYIATEEGYVFFDEESHILNVWKDYFINDNVNCYNGNIEVDGRLHIAGSVEDGAVVKAKGDIVVDGYVAGAQLESEQNILIRAGVNANEKGKITAKGSISSKFFENADVEARGNIMSGYFMNCRIKTDAKMIAQGEKSRIMGGNIQAAAGVEAAYIGGHMASSVYMDVGNKEEVNQRLLTAKKRCKHVQNEILQLTVGKSKIEDKIKGEELQKSTIYQKTLQAIEIKTSQKKDLDDEIKRLERVMKLTDRAYIKVGIEMQQESRVILCGRPVHLKGDTKRTEIRKQ